MNSNSTHFARSPLFSSLPVEVIQRLERIAEERQFRRRQIVFFAEQRSDCVFLLLTGRVKLVRVSPAGREITLAIVSPGELFGEAGLYDGTVPYGLTAESLEDTTVYSFRRTELETIITTQPEFLRNLFALQSLRRRHAEQRLAEFVFFDVSARLAHLLTTLAGIYGRNVKQGTLIRLKLTHQDLANLIGSTRETTTVILNDLRRVGLIDFSGRRIIVVDVDGLMQVESTASISRIKRDSASAAP